MPYPNVLFGTKADAPSLLFKKEKISRVVLSNRHKIKRIWAIEVSCLPLVMSKAIDMNSQQAAIIDHGSCDFILYPAA